MSRNKLMVLNTVVVFVTTIMSAIMGMIEIRLLLDKYGDVINGLIQTGNQALGYLSLLEAGICSAFMYKMYKAVAEKDNNKLSGLYNGFRSGMNRIVFEMLIVAIGISIIYPFFLSQENLGYLHTFSIFILLSLKTILPYKVSMVPKYMIILKEQRYKAELITGLSRMLTYLVEILLLIYTDWEIQILLIACICVALLSGGWFHLAMRKLYDKTLDKSIQPDVSPRTYSTSIVMHNISGLVFNSTDNVVLSILGSLRDVTVYSNYNMIVGQVNELAQKFVSGASAGMGIKIAGREKHAYSVYRELMTLILAIAGIVTTVFFVMINDFIELWVGRSYCVGETEKALFAIIIYCGIILPCLSEIRTVTGFFKESVWYTILQSVVNLVLTLVLVPNYGIVGALMGTVVARILISMPCNYFLVEKKVFPEGKNKWYELIAGVIIVVLSAWSIEKILQLMRVETLIINKWGVFGAKTMISTVIASVIVFIFYITTDADFRKLLTRMKSVLKKRV